MARLPLASTLLSGLVLLAIVAVVLRIRNWERKAPSFERRGEAAAMTLRSPSTWTAVFLLITLGFVAGAVLYLDPGLVGLSRGAVALALGAGVGAVFAGFLFAGVYAAARSRGLSSAPAVGIGSSVVGLLLIAAIALKLLLA